MISDCSIRVIVYLLVFCEGDITHREKSTILSFQVQTELKSVKEERESLRQQLESKIQTLQQLEGNRMEYEL